MMLPIVAGTIRSAVKQAEMDSKWQQKKKSGIFNKEDIDPVARQIQRYKEELEQMRESRKMSEISAKLKAGGSLNGDEIEYLKKNNPQMYRDYVEIQIEKEAYERQLKACKTKEDVEELKFSKMSGLMAEAKSVMNNPYIPEGKKLGLMEKILQKTMGIQKIHMEFVQSEHYCNLPTEEEAAEEEKDKAGKTEEAAEEVKEGIQEDEETADGIKENGEPAIESAKAGGEPGKAVIGRKPGHKKSGAKLPELKKKADAGYEAARASVIDYIRNNRPNGYGLDLLRDELDKGKREHS